MKTIAGRLEWLAMVLGSEVGGGGRLGFSLEENPALRLQR